MPFRVCVDCLRRFAAFANRGERCSGCKDIRIAQQKNESQAKRRVTRRAADLKDDISDEEIELRFTAALKEIRRQPVEADEHRRSYQWQYREPGC
jgi:hypothetical protein